MITINELYDNTILWQMSYAERMAIFYMLDKLEHKKVAIEIGSYKGGLLKELSRRFETVYSLDINHSNLDKSKYPNVIWIRGDSRVTLPKLVRRLNDTGAVVNFAMVDGDHSCDAVLSDINNLLALNVEEDMIIMAHDSWYPDTRKAIGLANWNANPHVHLVETDLVTGDLFNGVYVGGLALAILSPEIRVGDIQPRYTNTYMYETVTNLLKGE